MNSNPFVIDIETRKKPAPIARTVAGLEARCEKIPEAGCWIWMGRTTGGYGTLHATDSQPHARVHRLMYALVNGIPLAFLPADLCVRHRCDTPTCCNPDHLILGTWKQNVHDAKNRGRHAVAFQEIDGKIVGSCPNGHDLSIVGIYDHGIQKSGYRLRVCLQCKKDRANAYARKRYSYRTRRVG